MLLSPRQRLQRLAEIAKELREIFPNCSPSLHAEESGEVRLSLHRCHSYDIAVNAMRSLGFGRRDKQTLPEEGGKTVINATSQEFKLRASAYCNQLPPTCRVETYTVSVPKRKTVVDGTVEKTRKRIICDLDKEIL